MASTASIALSHYMPIPFKERGRDHDGVDCYGLVYLIAREQLGLEVPAYTDGYATCMDQREISAMIQQETVSTWRPVERRDIQLGDLVVLRIAGHPWHCGLMVNRYDFLHIERGSNVCRDRIGSLRWEKRIDGFYRWNQ